MSTTKKFTHKNESFTCVNCGSLVHPAERTCRNHCPNCLHSVHLDVFPGDRSADCGGVLQPIEIVYNTKKGYQIVHECRLCHHITRNIANLTDPIQPDRLEVILDLMKHPKR